MGKPTKSEAADVSHVKTDFITYVNGQPMHCVDANDCHTQASLARRKAHENGQAVPSIRKVKRSVDHSPSVAPINAVTEEDFE